MLLSRPESSPGVCREIFSIDLEYGWSFLIFLTVFSAPKPIGQISLPRM